MFETSQISDGRSLQFLEETKPVTMALGTAWKQMSWLYYQYLLVTALYMLEPWERTIFNSLLISVVGMAVYTGYVFMPQHIMAILHYFEIVQ
ncbi:serine palmitoyltransferase small subunit A isoform X2 [Heterodontus francisci]|uniref:serine palmitoyltransferase small subunit A isoform X2 n=1 Tax=Heterodontus francisci TaxID=7792 RepID=UPI00355C4459